MTEVDAKKNSNTSPKSGFVKDWARGLFRIELIESLTIGDARDTKTTLASTHDAGFEAGWHTQKALTTGQGYRVKHGQIERPVPAGQMQVASLDIYDDTAVHTTEEAVTQATQTESIGTPNTQALSAPISTRQFVVRIFSRKTAQELGLADLVKETDKSVA